MYSIRRCVPTFVVLLVLVSQQLLSQTPSQEPPASPQSISGTGSRPKQTKPNCTDNGTYVNSRGQTVKRPENCSSTCAAQEPMCGPANHRNGWLLTQLTASARNRDDWHSDSLVSPVKSRCDAAVKTQHFSSCFLSCL